VADAVKLLAVLALHLVLTGLPIVAAMLAGAALGVRRVPLLIVFGLAASGLVAILAFWAFYASALFGRTFTYLVPLGSLLLSAVCLRGGRVQRGLLRELATPLGLWALGSAFLLFLGFLHGGTADPLGMASTRFSSQLPSDNLMPGWFADYF